MSILAALTSMNPTSFSSNKGLIMGSKSNSAQGANSNATLVAAAAVDVHANVLGLVILDVDIDALVVIN